MAKASRKRGVARLSWPVFKMTNDRPIWLGFDEAESQLLLALQKGGLRAFVNSGAVDPQWICDADWRCDEPGADRMAMVLVWRPERQLAGRLDEKSVFYGRPHEEISPTIESEKLLDLYPSANTPNIEMDGSHADAVEAPKKSRRRNVKIDRATEALKKLYEGSIPDHTSISGPALTLAVRKKIQQMHPTLTDLELPEHDTIMRAADRRK